MWKEDEELTEEQEKQLKAKMHQLRL